MSATIHVSDEAGSDILAIGMNDSKVVTTKAASSSFTTAVQTVSKAEVTRKGVCRVLLSATANAAVASEDCCCGSQSASRKAGPTMTCHMVLSVPKGLDLNAGTQEGEANRLLLSLLRDTVRGLALNFHPDPIMMSGGQVKPGVSWGPNAGYPSDALNMMAIGRPDLALDHTADTTIVYSLVNVLAE